MLEDWRAAEGSCPVDAHTVNAPAYRHVRNVGVSCPTNQINQAADTLSICHLNVVTVSQSPPSEHIHSRLAGFPFSTAQVPPPCLQLLRYHSPRSSPAASVVEA